MNQFSNRNQIKNHDFFIFELLIIELCNMDCSYCYMRNDSPSWGKFSTKEDIWKVIHQLEKMEQKVSICLSGGEASLHPNFLEFVEYISNSKYIYELHINTNLRMNQDILERILNINPSVQFHISWHVEADNEFLNKIKYIPQNNQELNIMIHPSKKYKNDILEFIESCVESNIQFNLKPIFIGDAFKPSPYVLSMMQHSHQKKEYTDGIKEYSDFDLYSEDLLPMQTMGWSCYYIFYTIDCRQGNIKQMCKLWNDLNIFKDFQFFKNYDLSKPIKCPFDSRCLWASSLDHLKYKKD